MGSIFPVPNWSVLEKLSRIAGFPLAPLQMSSNLKAQSSEAASYAVAISQAHCFNDGNKRTAFQVMDLILDLNGMHAVWDVEEAGQKIVLLSQSKLDEVDLAQWLRRVIV
jgi:death-on-curing family protein